MFQRSVAMAAQNITCIFTTFTLVQEKPKC